MLRKSTILGDEQRSGATRQRKQNDPPHHQDDTLVSLHDTNSLIQTTTEDCTDTYDFTTLILPMVEDGVHMLTAQRQNFVPHPNRAIHPTGPGAAQTTVSNQNDQCDLTQNQAGAQNGVLVGNQHQPRQSQPVVRPQPPERRSHRRKPLAEPDDAPAHLAEGQVSHRAPRQVSDDEDGEENTEDEARRLAEETARIRHHHQQRRSRIEQQQQAQAHQAEHQRAAQEAQATRIQQYQQQFEAQQAALQRERDERSAQERAAQEKAQKAAQEHAAQEKAAREAKKKREQYQLQQQQHMQLQQQQYYFYMQQQQHQQQQMSMEQGAPTHPFPLVVFPPPPPGNRYGLSADENDVVLDMFRVEFRDYPYYPLAHSPEYRNYNLVSNPYLNSRQAPATPHVLSHYKPNCPIRLQFRQYLHDAVDGLGRPLEEYELSNMLMDKLLCFDAQHNTSHFRVLDRLLPIMCMQLAAKYYSSHPDAWLQTHDIQRFIGGAYSSQYYNRLEQTILQYLSYNLHAVTPLQYVLIYEAHAFLPEEFEEASKPGELRDLFTHTVRFFSILYTMYKKRYYPPSLAAAAILACTRHSMGVPVVWPKRLMVLTQYHFKHIEECYLHLQEVFHREYPDSSQPQYVPSGGTRDYVEEEEDPEERRVGIAATD